MLLQGNIPADLKTERQRGLPPPVPLHGSLWDKAGFQGPQLLSWQVNFTSFTPN